MEFIEGDVLSYKGGLAITSTEAGIVKMYEGRLVNFYGQAFGEDNFDEIDDVISAGFEHIGNINTDKELLERMEEATRVHNDWMDQN